MLDFFELRMPIAELVIRGSQLITIEDMQSMLRQQGIESMAVVKKASLEADGPRHPPLGT